MLAMEEMDCCEKGLPMESEVIEEFWGKVFVRSYGRSDI